MTQRELTGQTALVTGGSRGIGLAIAAALAEAGVRLHLVARSKDTLESARQMLPDTTEVTIHPADITDDAALTSLTEALPPIDILVHSAGYVKLASVADATLKTLDTHYQLNVRAPYALTQHLLPGLTERQGQIVFINSGAGLTANPNWSQYAMTKFALRAFADSLRAEVAPQGVRVISVYPGRTASDMQQQVRQMEGEGYDPSRFIQPQDIAVTLLNALRLPSSAQITDLTIRPFMGQ
jgi:NADP-dependent 3-hydroxy acid dehydrogenase YdfG